MMIKGVSKHYHWLSISLHWTMFLLLVLTFITIELRFIFPEKTRSHDLMRLWHYIFGTSIFFLVWLRLLVRSCTSTPNIDPKPAYWQHILAKIVHFGLYLFMLIAPLIGWLHISAANRTPTFYGVKLPVFVDPNSNLAQTLLNYHDEIALVGYSLIALHIIGALFHHYICRDSTLIRMLPKTGRSKTRPNYQRASTPQLGQLLKN